MTASATQRRYGLRLEPCRSVASFNGLLRSHRIAISPSAMAGVFFYDIISESGLSPRTRSLPPVVVPRGRRRALTCLLALTGRLALLLTQLRAPTEAYTHRDGPSTPFGRPGLN